MKLPGEALRLELSLADPFQPALQQRVITLFDDELCGGADEEFLSFQNLRILRLLPAALNSMQSDVPAVVHLPQAGPEARI
jgi:hypothetical protein